MKIKIKSETLVFFGFIVLATSFLGMIVYFQVQSEKLNTKENDLNRRITDLELREAELDETKEELNTIKELVPNEKQPEVDAIAKETEEKIKEEKRKIIVERKVKNPVYVHVSSEKTKSKLKNQDFIGVLNQKQEFNVIDHYDIVEKGVYNNIRYFNREDKELALQLRSDIQEEFSTDLKIKYLKGYKVKQGQLEIWIK